MIASLGMYDCPEVTPANNALWRAIRGELGYGPQGLDHATPPWDVWQSPELLLAQTCGMPYRTRLHGLVQLVGTPDYGLPNVKPGYYYSVFVVRAGDLGDVSDYFDRRFAYNDAISQSGWAAPQIHAALSGAVFQKLLHSGSHLNSAKAVANGDADIAAIDAVSWRLIRQFNDFANGLVTIGRTAPTPGLPLITSNNRDAQELFEAVRCALAGLKPGHRQLLGMKDVILIAPQDYLNVPTPPGP